MSPNLATIRIGPTSISDHYQGWTIIRVGPASGSDHQQGRINYSIEFYEIYVLPVSYFLWQNNDLQEKFYHFHIVHISVFQFIYHGSLQEKGLPKLGYFAEPPYNATRCKDQAQPEDGSEKWSSSIKTVA
jgi:hypothetical protein